ncbi:MAG: glycosyltransferase [Elainellaceae cyanobacterium]
MRILMISSTFPYPPSRGGTEIRTFNLLQHLQIRHQVTVVTQRHPSVSEEDVQALGDRIHDLQLFDLAPDPSQAGIAALVGKVQRFLTSLISGTPPNVLHRYSPEMQQWIDRQVEANGFDVITCEHSVNAVYIRPAYRQTVRTVLNAHSLIYNWVLNHLEMDASDNVLRDRLYLSTIKRYEKRYAKQFSTVVVTTSDDQAALTQICPDAASTIVPNGVDLALFPPRTKDPGGCNLVFVGAMDSSHNIDAVRFFVREVMPALQADYPQTTLTIVGARPAAEVLELAQHFGIHVIGKVDSTAPYLHEAVACVVPLRAGFGIKNKTLEAMAAGVPVVGSDRGLEGLSVDDPDQPLRALRANQPQEYVTAIRQLFESPELRAQLSAEGRSLIEATYTWNQAGCAYEKALSASA